ncbi:MAG TPA: PTS sugar transporter subunit IIB [Puia sp.]|nr:PTS sugar transporter subunit IIB [Puia sp.]
MIKLLRLDDRLLHGQVAFTWTPALGVDTLVIANDKLAKDEFRKMTLGLAKPPGTRLIIKNVAEGTAFLRDAKNAGLKMLVLVDSVSDAFALAEAIPDIRSINFGGLRTRDRAKAISKSIFLTDEDIALSRKLLERGLELEIRQVPTDTKQLLEPLI